MPVMLHFSHALVASWCRRKDGGRGREVGSASTAKEGLNMAGVKARRVLDGAWVRGNGRSR